MLSLLTESVSNASFGIYFPKFTGTIYELLSAPVSTLEIVVSYVGAAATKSVMLGLLILLTAGLFVELRIAHPFVMGPLPGADGPELQPVRLHHRHLGEGLRAAAARAHADHHAAHVPGRLVLFHRHAPAILADRDAVQPGSLSGERFPLEFYGISDVSVGVSLLMTLVFLGACIAVVWWIFATGYRLKT
jgi:ABC-2 type transport system permease protein